MVRGVRRRLQRAVNTGEHGSAENLDETLDNTLEMLERIATGSQLNLGEVATMRRRLLSSACNRVAPNASSPGFFFFLTLMFHRHSPPTRCNHSLSLSVTLLRVVFGL